MCACKTFPLEESWNSSPKEHSHKLTQFCFLNHPSAPPQGLGAVPFPNRFGTVSHKSWAVEAVEQRVMSWAQGANCSELAPESFFFPCFFLPPPHFHRKDFLLLFVFLFFWFLCILQSLPRCLFFFFKFIYLFLNLFFLFKIHSSFSPPLLIIIRKNKQEEIRE